MMKQFFDLLIGFRDSEIPEDRVVYRDSILEIIKLMERLRKLSTSPETQEYLERDILILKEQLENYSLYPNLKRVDTAPSKYFS